MRKARIQTTIRPKTKKAIVDAKEAELDVETKESKVAADAKVEVEVEVEVETKTNKVAAYTKTDTKVDRKHTGPPRLTQSLTDFKDILPYLTEEQLELPTLHYLDSKKKKRFWTIKLRLVKSIEKKSHYSKNWNTLKAPTVPLRAEYLDGSAELPAGTECQYWTEYGLVDGASLRAVPRYAEVTNQGRANVHNVLQNGVVQIKSEYIKKYKQVLGADYGLDKNADQSDQGETFGECKIYPQLLDQYDKYQKRIHFPRMIQPKLNGVRCLAYVRKMSHGVSHVELITRSGRNIIGFNTIETELALIFAGNPDIFYIDGELYKHGLSLQEINGMVSDTKQKKSALEFHVFDIIARDVEMSFSDRAAMLYQAIGTPDVPTYQHIIPVVTLTVNSTEEEDTIFDEWLKQNYEGLVLRDPGARYQFSLKGRNSATRSKFALKRKKVCQEEFNVVGYTDGNGDQKGAVIWVAETHDGKKKFDVVPNLSLEERHRQWQQCEREFDNVFLGRKLIVKFDEYSEDKVPLRAKALGFRDFM